MHSGAYLVEEQHHSLEWQEHITTDTSTNNLCRRQQPVDGDAAYN
jgi:hypothetical protein